ncbi:MAG TPA: hypothetical protein VK808_04535 [Bacteroidia bacterium]|jgi:hypothetical protein|nr:hypothetical protein [Bacteroidia bacterium]
MKVNQFLLSGITGVALSVFVLTGCHKDSTTTPTNNPSTTQNDITSAEDESNASSAMNDSKTISDAGMSGNQGKYGQTRSVQAIYSSNCTVTWSSKDTGIGGTDTMYVNFGSTPVECNDYRWRQGEIIVYWKQATGTLIQSYFDSSSVITMTFKNYAVGSLKSNMIGIAGTRVWTNTGTNALLEENWSFAANLTLTYSNAQTATWNSTRTNTLVQIGGIYYYMITGSASGTDRSNVGYSLNITSPLYVTATPWWLGGCAWIESGVLTVNVTGATYPISVNFGTVGSCDANAVATINGYNYPFIMY